jgi:hypothetical protein
MAILKSQQSVFQTAVIVGVLKATKLQVLVELGCVALFDRAAT